MERRRLLTGTGVLVTGILGALAVDRLWVLPWQERVNHEPMAYNSRESSHDVEIEVERDGETQTFGPRTLSPDEGWTAATLDDGGQLTVRYLVDGDLAWEDTHEPPELRRGRSSSVRLAIRSDGYEGMIIVQD